MQKCGCVGLRINNDAVIKYCPLHAAAPDLLKACEAFVDAWKHSHQLEKTDHALRLAEAAIAGAKGEGNRE